MARIGRPDIGLLAARRGVLIRHRSSSATFSDDFNRSNAASTGNGWASSLNPFPIVSNELGMSGPSVASSYNLTPTVATTGDQFVQFTVTARPTSTVVDPGAVVRYFNATADGSGGNPNTFFGRYNPSLTRWEMYKASGGTNTLLNSFTESAPALPYTIRFEAQGGSLKLFGNSVLKVSATDSSFTVNRRIGVGMRYTVAGDTAQRIDNFSGGDL